MSYRRNCTTCPLLGKPERVRAIYVAGNASGLEWFECEEHSAYDHPSGPRTRRETLADWFGRHGLPVPDESRLVQGSRLAEDACAEYLKTMRRDFGSDPETETARRALAQSMRDRSSRDQDEAARAFREVAAELRTNGSPAGRDTAETMELAATLRRSSG